MYIIVVSCYLRSQKYARNRTLAHWIASELLLLYNPRLDDNTDTQKMNSGGWLQDTTKVHDSIHMWVN